MKNTYLVIILLPQKTIDSGQWVENLFDDKQRAEKSIELGFKLGARRIFFIDNLSGEVKMLTKPEGN